MPPEYSSGALPAAVQWVEGVLLGTAGMTLAAIAVAWVGFAMLTGRIDWRRGLRVVLGCFILLGAPVIVAELRGMASGFGAQAGAGAEPARLTLPDRVQPRDPYAGASLPMNEAVRD